MFVDIALEQQMYSVMQSDGNSFYGDVVFDSFNNASRDKDSILDQKYKNEDFGIFISKILTLKAIEENAN